MEPKWEPESIKNRKKKPEKGIPKIMPKFDAEKKLKSWILHAIWIHVGDAGGKGAGRFWLI